MSIVFNEMMLRVAKAVEGQPRTVERVFEALKAAGFDDHQRPLVAMGVCAMARIHCEDREPVPEDQRTDDWKRMVNELVFHRMEVSFGDGLERDYAEAGGVTLGYPVHCMTIEEMIVDFSVDLYDHNAWMVSACETMLVMDDQTFDRLIYRFDQPPLDDHSTDRQMAIMDLLEQLDGPSGEELFAEHAQAVTGVPWTR
jgi:hypothetical protein